MQLYDSNMIYLLLEEKFKKFAVDLPLAASEMNAWACFLILLISVCRLLIGKRINKCSKKSNGVTSEMSHFNLLNTINSHCWKEKKKKKKDSLVKCFCIKSKHVFYFLFDWNKTVKMSILNRHLMLNSIISQAPLPLGISCDSIKAM